MPAGGLCCSQGTCSPAFPPRISLGRPWLGSWRGTWPRTKCWEPGGGRRALISGGIAQSQKAKAREAPRPPPRALPRKAALQTGLHPEGTCRQLRLSRDRPGKSDSEHPPRGAALLCLSSQATERAAVQPVGQSDRSRSGAQGKPGAGAAGIFLNE